MKKPIYLFILLALLLPACGLAPAPATPTATIAPSKTPTLTVTPSPTATITPTNVPISSLPVDVLVQKFMDGDVENLSSLSVEQQMLFSQVYAEKLNQQRGARPVIWNNESYIDPITGKFLDINNGTSMQEQTIQMYLPAYENAEGYLMVQTPDGQWIQIEESKNVRYEVTNDPFDPNINWPDTEKMDPQWIPEAYKDLADLPIPQYMLTQKGVPFSMIPIVILDKELGEIKIGGFGQTGLLRGLIIEKDAQGNPIGARVILLTGGLGLIGTDLTAKSNGQLDEISQFWQKLEEESLYYLIYATDQKKMFDNGYPQLNGEVTADYSGLVPSDQSHQVITGQKKSHNLILIEGNTLMIADY